MAWIIHKLASGNSVATLNLLRLYEFTTRDEYRQRAEKALAAFQATLDRAPTSMSEMLLALDFYTDTPKEVVIVTPASRDGASSLLGKLRSSFVPNRVLVVVTEEDAQGALSKLVPLVDKKVAREGRATAYVCERRVCKLPTTDPEIFAGQIRTVEPLEPATREKSPP